MNPVTYVGAAKADMGQAADQVNAVSEGAVGPGASRRVSRRSLLGWGLGLAGASAVMARDVAATSGTMDIGTAAHPPAAQADPVTIRFIKGAGPGYAHDNQFVTEFMEANPNITVQVEEVIYDELFDKCLALGATNNLADVFFGHNIWAPYLAYKGLCLDLDPAVEAGQITNIDDFYPSVLEDARRVGTDGRLMWLPNIIHPAGNAAIMFNMTLMDEAGVQPPENGEWTIDDYEEIIRAAAQPDRGIYGTDVTLWHPLYTQQYTRSWGSDPDEGSEDAWLLSADGTTQQLDSPPVREALEWYWRFIGERLVPTATEKAALQGTGATHFTAGQMATTATTINGVASTQATVGDRFPIYAVLWPRGPHGYRGSALSYNNDMVWSQTQQPEAAIKLLDQLTGPDPTFWTRHQDQGFRLATNRRSSWTNPEIQAIYPLTKEAAEWLEAGVDPFPQPLNLRFVEWQNTWNQETTAYFDGSETFDEMFAHTQPRCQEILDLPLP